MPLQYKLFTQFKNFDPIIDPAVVYSFMTDDPPVALVHSMSERKNNMGYVLRGDHLPGWHVPIGCDKANPDNSSNPWYRSNPPWWWNVVLPWYVVAPGVGHAATNVRVKISNMRLYVKYADNNWYRIGTGDVNPSGSMEQQFNGTNWVTNNPPDARTEVDGALSVRPKNIDSRNHGWDTKRVIPSPDRLRGIFVMAQHQLILHDTGAADDSANSKLMIQLGCDCYPTMSATPVDLGTYMPAISVGGFRLSTAQPQWIYAATIMPPDAPRVAGQASPYLTANPSAQCNLTFEQFAANPPIYASPSI